MMQISIKDASTESRLSFTLRMDESRPWWRDLDLDGQPLYRIGNICDTCEAMFSKYKSEKLPLEPSRLAEILRSGLSDIPNEVVEIVTKVLPKGNYSVGLLNLQPALIKFSEPNYYLWENSKPSSIPTEWLTESEPIQPWWFAQPNKSRGFQKGKLYEAVLPLISEKSIKREDIDKYSTELNDGLKPTALALSVVDVRSVSGRAFDWRLIHFLLDGHHKMMAASKTGKPITLLSFLNIDESFAPKEWIERAIQVRYKDNLQNLPNTV